jgi:hypothetical protein
MTIAAVVLEVGANPKGQASLTTLTSILTEAARASVEEGLPVSVMSGTPKRFIKGNRTMISSVSP